MHLGVRRCSRDEPLPRRVPATLATKPPARTEPRTSGNSSPALSPRYGKLAQRLVEVVADVRGRDLVGRDVVAELRGAWAIRPAPRVERQVLAGELAMQQRRVLGEQQHASVESDAVRNLVYGPRAKTLDHASEDAGRGRGSQASASAERTEPGA